MNIKKLVQWFVITVLLVTSFMSTGGALAWSKCPTYITVQWGDTLSGIAKLCDTTVDAIRAANPGLGWWLYAGQTLYIPTGYTPPSYPPTSGTYVVQSGDTLGKIAARGKTSVSDILAVNPQIYNPSLIYVGQVINLPAGVNVPPPTNYPPPPPPTKPTPPPVDSYSSLNIAYKYGMYIRSEPGGTIIASALDTTRWQYKPSSIFIDKKWKVWVQVKISPPAKGYSTGWLLVKDQFGAYFTDPQIDP
jgi:LysM repeat protein